MPLCMQCAVEGRGQVALVPRLPLPVEPAHSEPPEPEPAPMVAGAAASTFKYDCARDGHRFIGLDGCAICGTPQPEDPARGARSVMAAAVLFAAVSLLAPRCAQAAEWQPPDSGEIAALVATEALIAVDILQTVDMTHRYSESQIFYEANPLLGLHPSTERVIASGIVGGLATAGLWLWLPPRVRLLVPIVVGSLEIVAVTGNACAGLRVRF